MVRRWKPPWCCKCEAPGIILGWSLQQSIVTSDITRVELWMLWQEEKLHPLQSRPSGASTLAIWAEEGALVPLFLTPLGSQRYELSCYPSEFPFAWNLYAWSEKDGVFAARWTQCAVLEHRAWMPLGFPVIFAVNATAQPVQTGGINGDERRRTESSRIYI